MTTPRLSEQAILELGHLGGLTVSRVSDAEFKISVTLFGELDPLFQGTLERCSDFIRGFYAARENP